MNVKILHNCTGTASAGFVVKPQSSSDEMGSPSTTFNTTSGVITLPNRPCVLNAGLMYYDNTSPNPSYQYFDYQWYDETNSQYIGSKARLKGWSPDYYFTYETLSCDEQAIAVAQNINVSLRIIGVSISGGLSHAGLIIDGEVSQTIYAGQSRLIIYEF